MPKCAAAVLSRQMNQAPASFAVLSCQMIQAAVSFVSLLFQMIQTAASFVSLSFQEFEYVFWSQDIAVAASLFFALCAKNETLSIQMSENFCERAGVLGCWTIIFFGGGGYARIRLAHSCCFVFRATLRPEACTEFYSCLIFAFSSFFGATLNQNLGLV